MGRLRLNVREPIFAPVSGLPFIVKQPIVTIARLPEYGFCIQALKKNLIHDVINGRVEAVDFQKFLMFEFMERTIRFQSFHLFSPSVNRV